MKEINKETVINAYLETAHEEDLREWDMDFPDISELDWAENVDTVDILELLEDVDFLSLVAQTGMTDEQLGHDLWLTRQGHGAGFWDRGYPYEIGNELTEYAKALGTVDIYIDEAGYLNLT